MPRVAHTNLKACEPSSLLLPGNFGGYNFLSAFAQLHNSREQITSATATVATR